jgi:hypothetical protein
MPAQVQMHAHKCMACAKQGKDVVWWHAETERGKIAQHTCPTCGNVEWKKWLVEPGSLPQYQNGHGTNTVDMYVLLGYAVFAVCIAILCYAAYFYVMQWREGKLNFGKNVVPD